MDKSKKRIIMVVMVLALLIVGIATYAIALKWAVLAGIAAWVASNPGSAACGVVYEPSSPNPPYHEEKKHGHFGASAKCEIVRGMGYYEGMIAARGTLQPKENSVGHGNNYWGMAAYAESGFFSSSGRITALSVWWDGRWRQWRSQWRVVGSF